MPARISHWVAAAALASGLALAPAAPAAADVIVPDDQIVRGKQCVGVLCADGESFTNLGLKLKSADTPGVSLVQTGDAGFTAQTWDVAGNEANFFIRDLTGGSRLPFRIRPGAPTSTLDLQASGAVDTVGIVQQNVSGITPAGDADGAAILTALRTLPIQRYTINVDTGAAAHLAPAPAAFRSAFSVGVADDRLAPGDVAAVALAAVKELDARVRTLQLTPGPQGERGEAGPQGAPGAPGTAAVPESAGPDAAEMLADAETKMAALKKSNRKLSRKFTRLRQQVKRMMATR